MTIKSAGSPISLTDIQTEFNGVNPISLSEYYAGGNYVSSTATGRPTGSADVLIPASGSKISLSNFYGSASTFKFVDRVTTSFNNYSLIKRAKNLGWNGTLAIDANIIIETNVRIGSTSTLVPAMIIESLPAGSSIVLTNKGIISGAGGNGAGSQNTGSPGGAGLQVLHTISITNNYIIQGGGGGGGAGGPGMWGGSGGGGGGGGGFDADALAGRGGVGGFGGLAATVGFRGTQNGSAGSLTAGGSGGDGGTDTFISDKSFRWGGAGGRGGDPGMPGSPGADSKASVNSTTGPASQPRPGTPGGAAGPAVIGDSKITWSLPGTIKGSKVG